MAAVSTLERTTFACARCGGTIERTTRPRTCPHCQAKKADRCQMCERAVYIGAVFCPEHAAAVTPLDPARTPAMLPLASAHAPAPARRAPPWVASLARAAIAIVLLAPLAYVVRSQTALRRAGSYDDLRAMLVADGPLGFTRVDDPRAGSGPVDFEQVVADDIEGPDAARKALSDAGLLRGYLRRWEVGNGKPGSVEVELYQYAHPAGAAMDQARLDRLAPEAARRVGASWQTFGVPTVPGAHGYQFSEPRSGAVMVVVAFARGPYGAAVVVSGTDTGGAKQSAVDLAEQQRAALSKAERFERLVTDAVRNLHR
jgi:hypothetical protein